MNKAVKCVRTLSGEVVSAAMKDTIVILIERQVKHPPILQGHVSTDGAK